MNVEWQGGMAGGMVVLNGCVEWLGGMVGVMAGFFAVKRRVVFVLFAMPSTS